jgi:hypothetical protein
MRDVWAPRQWRATRLSSGVESEVKLTVRRHSFEKAVIARLDFLRHELDLKIQAFSAAIKTQVASGDASRPGEEVRSLYREFRKLQADYLRQVRLLQRSIGISEAEISRIERARHKQLLPDGADQLWRDEIEHTSINSYDLDHLARQAVVRLTGSVSLEWLRREAQQEYRLESSFLTLPLHLVNGIRVGMGHRVDRPQRFARMLLITRDHLEKRLDLDFFSGATLVPELAVLGNSLDEIKELGAEAERKLTSLPQLADEQVSSTIYELLVGTACVRAGLDLAMIPEDRSKKVPEYRIKNLHVPAVLECKRRRGLTEYEMTEAAHVERLYHAVRPELRKSGVYGSLEACFSAPLQSIGCADFAGHVLAAVARPDQEHPVRTAWGWLAFKSLPYRRSISETRLYSPEYLQQVFDWEVLQDDWDGILCEVDPPLRINVELFSMPLCLKWRSESDEAITKKARGIRSLWVEAVKQIPDGEMGFVYIAYPEGSRAAIADARTRQVMKELNQVGHRWSVHVPATVVSRLYGRALGCGYPDFIENVLLGAAEGQEFWLTKLPQRVFT